MDPEMAVKMMAYKERQDAKLQRCANKIRWFLDLLLWLLKYNLSRIVDRTERQVGGQSVDNAAGKWSDAVMFWNSERDERQERVKLQSFIFPFARIAKFWILWRTTKWISFTFEVSVMPRCLTTCPLPGVTTKSSFDPRSAVGKRSSGWPERRSMEWRDAMLRNCSRAACGPWCRGMSGKVSITSARHWDFDCLRSMVAGLSLWATGLKLRGIYPSTSCLRLGTESSPGEMNKMIPQLPEYQISTKMLAFLAGEWRSEWDCREKCLRK